MRNGFRLANAFALVLGITAFSFTAHALPVTCMFNGPDGFGVSEADALASGLPIFSPAFVGSAEGIFDIAFQDLDEASINPSPPSGPGPHTATSAWQMQNISDFDLEGSTFLLFVTVDPFEIGGQVFDYPDANVGLTIDPADGWFLVQTSFMDGADLVNLYYPALLLGSLAPDEITDTFAVNYFINQEIDQVGNTFILPQLRIGLGFEPIPEPGTFALFGLGLMSLALKRRRRA